jgi:uncharacterized membrane protein HdeD (DUF308 family)
MIAFNTFLLGAFALACAAVALFFFRYWRKTHERLFAILALAFTLLAMERTVLAFVPPDQESRHWIFLVRLSAFLLIIAGIIDKNRPRRRQKKPS